MPRVSDIVICKQMQQPILYIRAVTSVEKLPGLIGQSYGEIAAHLNELGEYPAGAPFVAFYNMDMQRLKIDMGFPVCRPLPGKADIQTGEIEESKAAVCMYRGVYNEVGPIYREMASWIAQHGQQARGTSYEYYYNSPSVPEEELLTQIVLPLK